MTLEDGSLGRSAARGAAVTITGQLVRVVLLLGGTAILARLLNPSDFGLVTMVVAVVGVAEVFRDFGLSSAAVQSRTLSSGQKNNLFWVNSAIGLVLGLAVFLSSGLIATLYQEPRLTLICRVLAVTFLIGGVSTQFKAELARRMRFNKLVVVDTVAPAVGVATGILLASADFGFWALVGQQVANALTALILVMTLAGWWPGALARDASITQFVRFGLPLVGSQLLNYTSRNIDSVLIGTRLGPVQLGLYDRAFQILMLPLNQINAPATKVALPVLSRLQDDRARYDRFLLHGQTVLVHVVAGVFAIVAAQTDAVVLILLGDQWDEVVPIFRVLAVGGFAQAAGYVAYWVFLSKGLTASNFRYALVSRPLLILLLFLGANWGLLGVAAAYSLGTLVMWPLSLWWLRDSTAPVGAMFFNGARALGCYGAAGVVSFAVSGALQSHGLIVSTTAGILAFFVFLSLLFLIFARYRADVRMIMKTGNIAR